MWLKFQAFSNRKRGKEGDRMSFSQFYVQSSEILGFSRYSEDPNLTLLYIKYLHVESVLVAESFEEVCAKLII